MNKLKKAAYMFCIGIVVCLCGCGAKGGSQMYLEAKVQDTQADGSGLQSQVQDQDQSQGEEPAQEGSQGGQAEPETCFVYICGAVKYPGVFELPQGSRVYEAVALAGGLKENAYVKGLNQAKQIEDGEMIEVLTKKEHKELAKQQSGETGGGQQDAGNAKNAAQDAEKAGSVPRETDGRIDLNTATAQELMTLSGIGEAKAANIIAYRESSGGFQSAEEIMNVSGIGEGVYARIQDKITVIQ